MTADEIMTADVTTLDEGSTLGDALELMEEQDIRHVPVVRGGEVIGMLSDRDLRSLGVSLVSDLESLDKLQARLQGKVSSLMTGNVFTVDRAADVKDVMDLMIEEKVSAVPVVEDDTATLVGIISYVDVLRALRDTLD